MDKIDYYDPFNTEQFYHVYNRSNNREAIYLSDENYRYFLQKFDEYLSPFLDVYAFCLLPNHFHFMLRVKSIAELLSFSKDDSSIDEEKNIHELVTEQFRRFFIAYTMAFNKQNNRNGNLFHRRFKHVLIDKEDYFTQLIYYIHLNPVKHNVGDYANYKWSSYQRILDGKQSKLKKQEVLDWFGGRENYIQYHKQQVDLYNIEDYLIE